MIMLAATLFGLYPQLAQDTVIRRTVAEVSPSRIEADVRTLVGFGTRHTMSDTVSATRGIGAARRWIHAELERIGTHCGGCLDVRYVSELRTLRSDDSTLTNVVNIIAIQRGAVDPDRMLIMSGDIDSRVSDNFNAIDSAPGANDNASGVAGVLEAARVLSQHRFPATIVYALLAGEEQGLHGGETLAAMAVDSGWRVEAVLNNDMIGNIQGVNGVIDNTTARVFSDAVSPTESDQQRMARRYTGGEVDGPSRQLARYVDRVAETYLPDIDVMLVYRLDRYGRGGHHRPFANRGYPAVRIMEANENYTRQHQDIRVEEGVAYGDVLEGVNFGYAARLTGLNVATLASLALAPSRPADPFICGAVQPAARLYWSPPADSALVGGYRVYWRLTDQPQWDHFEWAGEARSHTFTGRVIDNFFFGVAAVGHDGHESVVAFPRSGTGRECAR